MKGIIKTKDGAVFVCKELGGPGSGNFDHAGVPGERGGSAPGGGAGGEPTLQQRISAALKKERDERDANKRAVANTSDKSDEIEADFKSKYDELKGDKSHVKIYNMRDALGVSKDKFDDALMKLRDESKIQLIYGEMTHPTAEQLKKSFTEDGVTFTAFFYI